MNALQITGLEGAVLDCFHRLYQGDGFPPTNSIRVLQRKNTGAGRYVELESDQQVELDDRYIDMSGHFIEMSGLPSGMMAVVLVKGRRIQALELTVYGGDSWDGEEREWKIV
jgi:hypothetical protein